MSTFQPNNVDYGFSQPLNAVFNPPVVSKRIPTTADKFPIGTVWCRTSTNDFYVLTSIVNNLANWTTNTNGSGIFTSITVTTGPNDIEGTTTINTAGSASTSIGNNSGASGIAMLVGTGNFTLNGAATSTYTIGAATTTGTITIGGTAESGTITLGSSSATNILALGVGAGATTVNIATGVTNAKTVNIGTGAAMANTLKIGGTGANVITIGNTQTAGSIALGDAMTSGTIAIGGTGVAVGNLTLGNSTGAQAVRIAQGSGASVVTIANAQVAGSVSIGAAMTTGTINIGSALSGLVTMPAVPVTAAGTTVVNNVRVGQAIYTGNVTGAATALVLTLTNSLISATSSIFMTVSNLGSNDAQMTLYRVKPGAGTCAITLFNNGAAALNGDVQVSFWIN